MEASCRKPSLEPFPGVTSTLSTRLSTGAVENRPGRTLFSYVQNNPFTCYAFDPTKLAASVAKHGVWFSAADEFEWESALVVVDSRKSYGEPRLRALGLIGERACS